MNFIPIKSRRNFIKGVGAGILWLQLPLWIGCSRNYNRLDLTEDEVLLHNILNILFPKNPGPDIDTIHTLQHIRTYLNDQNEDPDEQKFLLNGIMWTRETSQELFQKDFSQLHDKERLQLVKKLTKETWGNSWLSKLLSLNFEALLLDPIYHVNEQEAGWKWLQHTPGIPRPNKLNKYPEILNRKNESIIITDLSQL